MPVHFVGYEYNPNVHVVCSDAHILSVEQITDMDALAEIIPEEFEILQARVLWSYCDLHGVDFLGNGEYRIFQAAVPVQWIGGGPEVQGIYPLIIYENNAIPILGGREEDGMPKVYCDISAPHHVGNHWWAAASYECETILKLNFREDDKPQDIQPACDDGEHAAKVINFGNRSIPRVGKGGMAFHDYIAYPQEYKVRRAFAGSADLTILPLDAWYKNPAMFRTLAALDSLPKLGFEHAMRQDGTITMYVSDSYVLG